MSFHRCAVGPARLFWASLALVLLFAALVAAASPAAHAATPTTSATASSRVATTAVAQALPQRTARARRAARQRKALTRCLRSARKVRKARVRAARIRTCRRLVRAAKVTKPKRSSTGSGSTTPTPSTGETTGTVTEPAPAPSASTTSGSGASTSGISVGGAFQNQDATALNRDLDALHGIGSRWIRIDINWAQIQGGGPSSYNWTNIDRVVQGATARGMQVLGVIVYSPSWARPAGTTARHAPDPAQYAQFAATAAKHYAALGVHAYEIWNEPNIPVFWQTKPDVAAYTQLLKAAYPAIKSADPSATVLTGGTSPAPSDGVSISPVDFVKGIYANGGGGSFDAVAHHPYCWPAYPGDAQSWSAWYQMYGTSPSLRSVMTANGDGAKKIWATEFGAPTNGPVGSFVGEDAQAQMVAKGYSLWKSYEWSGPMFTYSGRDLGTTTDTRENFFGLLRNDFSRKPAATAFQNAA